VVSKYQNVVNFEICIEITDMSCPLVMSQGSLICGSPLIVAGKA
jgi:hypothetical protein